MRFLNLETKDNAQHVPDRMHLEWVDTYHQAAIAGPGPALRSEADLTAARDALAQHKTLLEAARLELVDIRNAADSTKRMATMNSGVDYAGFVPGDGYHWQRERIPQLEQQLTTEAALIDDLEIRIEDWISGKPLPPLEPVRVHPAPEAELSVYQLMEQRRRYRYARARL
jgi:hypothetical protein